MALALEDFEALCGFVPHEELKQVRRGGGWEWFDSGGCGGVVGPAGAWQGTAGYAPMYSSPPQGTKNEPNRVAAGSMQHALPGA